MTGSRRLFDIKDLKFGHAGATELDGLSFSLDAGQSLVVLGDGSSGNDALLRVLANFSDRGDETGGTIQYGDGEVKPLHRRGKPAIRIAYLGSARAAPLNPYASVVSQLVRVVARKENAPASSAREDLRIALERHPQAPPFQFLSRKPRELSDVQLAWMLLAAAAAQTPDLLIADHAFSGLTPTAVESLCGALMAEQKRQGFALVYFAEALQAAARLRCRMIVLRRGKVIEEGDFEKLASGQSHAYTQILFKALPRLDDAVPTRGGSRGEPLLQVQGLDLSTRKRRRTPSRDAISFELRRGASLALVGEEGSGRRALVRAVLGLDRFWSGRVVLDQVDMSILSAAMTSRLRRRIAFVTGSDDALDPRMTLWDTVDEPLRAHLRLPRDMIADYRDTALKRVGLASHDGKRAVASLSAFDKRRLQVARAIVSTPFLAVIDEPLRGLDAFAQSIMIELLEDLRKQEGPAFLIVTADMRIAQALADDIMIFKDGKLVERGLLGDIMRAPKTDEARKLLAASAPRTRGPEPVAEPPKAELSDESQPFQAEPPEKAPASAAEAEQEPEPGQSSLPEELDSPILLDEPIADETEIGEQFQDGVTETPE
jgi:peptide/nickel transport system ATP-binding protein